MSLRTWIVLGLLLGAVGWWYSPLSPRVPDPPRVVANQGTTPTRPAAADTRAGATTTAHSAATAAATATTSNTTPVPGSAALATGNPLCPPPPRVAGGGAPLQSPVPSGFPSLNVEDARLTALAGFSIEARVLSRRDYAYGREADYSPTDLALGWGRMDDATVIERLDIQQRGRWYHYRWGNDGPPIPSREIAMTSANMHLIPADESVAAALSQVRQDQQVRIDGWLVELSAGDGWRWRSSLTRDDQGAGACEVIYACSITPL
jgi:hypothetical protein